MKKGHKIEIVIAIIGASATVAASVIGITVGKEQQNKYVQSQVADISGDGNTVTMNSVDDLIENYQDLQKQVESLNEKNDQYYSDYKTIKEEKDALESQLVDCPSIQLKNLGLSIDGEDININNVNSYAIIDGAEYFSKAFIDNLVSDNTSITIKDDVMYLGKVISDKTNLFSLRVIDSSEYKVLTNTTDSYGNTHSNVAQLKYNSIVNYSLDEKYSLMRFKIAMDESSHGGSECIITIRADDQLVYTSDKLDKVSTKEVVCEDININNCSRLEIECTGDYSVYPIIYDAVVYN